MANLLKIATTFTETKSIEKEIELPYYFKDKYDCLCKIVSTDYFLSAKLGYKGSHYSIEAYQVDAFKDRILTGTPATADEFDAAYSQAMMYVDLINKNQDPSNEHDENVQIDEMLERISA